MKKDNSIKPFQIQIADKEIEDLNHRLKQTRWPPPIESSNWKDGTDGDYLHNLVAYWSTQYNWRDREARLNKFNHYIADIEDSKIHFIHAPGDGPHPIPLLLLQGWPSSFVQMVDIIPLLTGGQDNGKICFDVVAASLPGYPFSEFPTRHGMSFAKIADLLTKLMVEKLGYKKFAARGSDQGAIVQQQIGLKYPEYLIGIHRTGITPFSSPMPENLSEAEIAYQKQVAASVPSEIGYAQIQGLRPETLTPALADSPVGLASWMIEKFQRWGDCNDDIDTHFNRDKLLDNISLHWFTRAGAASIRIYKEVLKDLGMKGKVGTPTAIIIPLRDRVTIPAPREWAERFYNIKRWTVMERGGHFSEWEMPVETAADISEFFSGLQV